MQEICYCTQYREDQLYITPEIKVFHMLLERCHTENREGAIKRHIQYFNFRSKIQLDLSVHVSHGWPHLHRLMDLFLSSTHGNHLLVISDFYIQICDF